LARRQHVRHRNWDRWPRQRQTDRSPSEQGVLIAHGAQSPAEFRRVMEALPYLVGKFRIGGETRQNVVGNDEASAGPDYTSLTVNVGLAQEKSTSSMPFLSLPWSH